MTPHILLAYVVQTDIPDRHHQISRNIFNLLLLCSSPNQFESIGYDILACFVIVQDAQSKKICLGVLLLKESFKTSFIHLSFLHTFHYALKRRRNRTVWSRQRYTFLWLSPNITHNYFNMEYYKKKEESWMPRIIHEFLWNEHSWIIH